MKKLNTKMVCEMARALKGVSEKEHFGSDAFIANGRIFATVWHNKNEVNLMINREQQKEFLVRDGSEGFHRLENSWGDHAINVKLEFMTYGIFAEALEAAWKNSGNSRSLVTGRKKTEKKTKTPASPRKKPLKNKGSRT